MAFASRLVRFGIVFAVVGTIASQLPVSGVTALAKNKCKANRNTEYKIVNGTSPGGKPSDSFTAATGNIFSTYFDRDDNVIGNYQPEVSNWTLSGAGYSFLSPPPPGGTVRSGTQQVQVTVGSGSGTLTAQSNTDPSYFVSVQLN